MGTDVHMVGEYYDKWDEKYNVFPIPDKFTGRYYDFFAAIGNIRNGYGFAGCYRHEEIEPISDNRGIPENASSLTKSIYKGNDSDIGINWLGDHFFSYVTLEELKEYDWPIVIKGGVMAYEAYCEWDKVSRPEEYSGGISGQNIITIDESEIEKTNFEDNKRYYISFKFKEELVRQVFIDEFIQFLSLYKGWRSEDKDVRIVFGFDS